MHEPALGKIIDSNAYDEIAPVSRTAVPFHYPTASKRLCLIDGRGNIVSKAVPYTNREPRRALGNYDRQL
jgi:hypothetical protein